MKVLVFSDSHGSAQPMIDAIQDHKDADAVVFLGDGERDFEEALAVCGIAPYGPKDSLRVFQVCGNCDRFSMEPVTITAEMGGIKTLITHGHDQNVKFGYARLFIEARSRDCRLALFGHTHLQRAEEKDGILLLNPGSIRSGKYAIVEMKDGRLSYELKE